MTVSWAGSTVNWGVNWVKPGALSTPSDVKNLMWLSYWHDICPYINPINTAVELKYPSDHLKLTTMTTPRLLLVGSSHMTRVWRYLETTPNNLVYLSLDLPGLKASDGLQFVKNHHQAIKKFCPTHVIVLLGGNDILPKRVEEPVGSLATTIEKLRTLGEWLENQFNVKVKYSELLPHPHRPTPPGVKLPDLQHKYN